MKKLSLYVFLGFVLLAGCSGGYDKEDEAVLEKCADLSFKQTVQLLSMLQDTQGAYSQQGEGELKKIEQLNNKETLPIVPWQILIYRLLYKKLYP